ncbi:MAG: Cyanate hydratase [Chaenotheca gracillima]|nr:MAG: Cyanate hydratase [Chaenotheca gracillima]
MSRLGLAATFLSLEKLEAENPLIAPPVTVSSSHTKHALEDLHPNISVFRHPDHLPDAQTLQSSFLSSLQNLSLTASMASKLPADALKAIYGMNEDVILYWAHHEKLCLVDGEMAFMGGLDLCYGRWDTNQHPIADAHPGNLDETVFPGQDYNNARIMDFQDVVHYEQNKLDRKTSSRMGWSDMSICLKGPIIQDLQSHFVERWNFIYNEKYDVRKDTRYSRLSMTQNSTNPTTYGQAPQQAPSSSGHPQTKLPSSQPNRYDQGASQTSNQQPYFPPPPGRREVESERGYQGDNSHQDQERHHGWERAEEGVRENLRGAIHEGVHHVHEKYEDRFERNQQHHAYRAEGAIPCQLVRSCTKWSNGTPTEHSIANAYIKIIEQSQHFVYIENQFFITATSDSQKPIRNKIGAAIVERIIRAARQGQKYKMIVVMPSVPAFAGDLKEDSALGTRAIMEFQYDSINRGGHSIMEEIARQGIDPMQYIRFYNLRNYDRINASSAMAEVEARSGVNYDDARRQHDDMLGAGFGGRGEGTGVQDRAQGDQYQRYQEAAGSVGAHQGLGKGRWDSVSECYMLGGEDIRNVPWENGDINEIDAFVSEELYVHSKVLIADDQVVICGSANLNDRSQLGDHDSEIALIIEDPTSLDSSMNGRPWRASRFAATLRRQMFRKHLGLLRSQDMERPDQNFEPVGVPNGYDFGSGEDRAVEDPLADSFHGLWNSRARVNTEAFGRVFHCVPHDNVKNWKDYEQFYERYFHEEGKEGNKRPAKYQWGHVVAEEFAPGDQGVREMKDVLSQIRGTLVEMPLLFLIEEDIAKEGISLNAFTEELYT